MVLFSCARTQNDSRLNSRLRGVPRRTGAALEEDAVAALTEALARLGVTANVLTKESPSHEARPNAVVEVAGQRFDVEVKSVVTAEHGERLATSAGRRAPLLVVADRIAADAKRSLQEAGVNYFDRRLDRGPAADRPHRRGVHAPDRGHSRRVTRQPGGQRRGDLLLADAGPAPRSSPDRPLHRPSPQRRFQRHGPTARRRPSHLRRRGHNPGSLPRSPRRVETTSRCAGGAPRHRRPGDAPAGARARRTRGLDGLGAHRHPGRLVVGPADHRTRRPPARFQCALGVSSPRWPLTPRRSDRSRGPSLHRGCGARAARVPPPT